MKGCGIFMAAALLKQTHPNERLNMPSPEGMLAAMIRSV
jgi:hypothetical protein